MTPIYDISCLFVSIMFFSIGQGGSWQWGTLIEDKNILISFTRTRQVLVGVVHLLVVVIGANKSQLLGLGLKQESNINPIQGGILSWRFRGGSKNACATYFGHISSMEAQIFLKFETYVHKIVLDHQPNFHKDPHARGENARTRDALQRFRSDSTKIKIISFSALFQ